MPQNEVSCKYFRHEKNIPMTNPAVGARFTHQHVRIEFLGTAEFVRIVAIAHSSFQGADKDELQARLWGGQKEYIDSSMGTANSNPTAIQHVVQGNKFIIERTLKEETEESEIDWSGQRSGEELKVL